MYFEKNILFKIFGSGYGNVPENVYLNGVTYILNTLGAVGLCIFFLILLRSFAKGRLWQKVGVMTFALLTVFSQTFTPASLIFYLCIYKYSQIENENERLTG